MIKASEHEKNGKIKCCEPHQAREKNGQQFKKLKKELKLGFGIFVLNAKTWKLTTFSCMIKDIQKWAWK